MNPYDDVIVPTPSRLFRSSKIDEFVLTLSDREALYENDSFPERGLAALVAAKIYYHLQEYNESMVFALAAGNLFDIDREGEFEDTLIG